jgi:hypothetical protein
LTLQELITKWQNNQLNTKKYAYRDGLLFYKNRLCLGDDSFIKAQVLAFVHNDPVAGYSGFERTMQRAKRECEVFFFFFFLRE